MQKFRDYAEIIIHKMTPDYEDLRPDKPRSKRGQRTAEAREWWKREITLAKKVST